MHRRVIGTAARIVMWGLVLALPGQTARAAGWADAMFAERSHDFGPVPRGAKVRHNFVLANQTAESVTVLDVRASCGCTTGRASEQVVKPGGTAAVEAEMDTRNFVGKKATVLYVTLVSASGREAEVRLGVSSEILSDVVLNPGTVDFGVVGRGQGPTRTVTVERVGSPGWQVRRMVSSCKAIDATLTESSRDGQGVSYLLNVTLKPDAPPGVIRDEIRLLTNDLETPVFPVQVTATVRGDLTASPAVLALGSVTSAEGARGRFLVRSSRPFVVRAIEGEGKGFRATVDSADPKPVHIVTVSYTPGPGTHPGDLGCIFRLHTDLPDEPPLDLTATASVGQ